MQDFCYCVMQHRLYKRVYTPYFVRLLVKVLRIVLIFYKMSVPLQGETINLIFEGDYMKKIFMLAAIALVASNVSAQTTKWIDNVKLSGYGIAQYQLTTQDNAKSNSFNLRLGRVSIDGRLFNDWAWKVQIQFNGNTSTLGSSPRVVDGLFSSS